MAVAIAFAMAFVLESVAGSGVGSLVVHVFDPHGHRLEGALVRVLRAPDLDLAVLTGSHGEAAFPAVPTGLGYKIEVSAEGYRTHIQRLVPVTSSGEVHLSVRVEQPSAGVTNIDPLTGETQAQPRPALIEGNDVLVVCPARRFGRCAGGDCRCASHDHGAASIEIVVLDPAGLPLAGALFSATVANHACRTFLTADDAGKGHFEKLVAGTAYDIEIVGGLLWTVEKITPQGNDPFQQVVRLSYPEGRLAIAVDSCTIPLPSEASDFGTSPARADRLGEVQTGRTRLASAFIEVTRPDPLVVFPRDWTARP
jgi:hypothetical protein